MTVYCLLVIILTTGFGLSNLTATLSYCGQSTVPTMLDWVLWHCGLPPVSTTTSQPWCQSWCELYHHRLYWLGLYKRHTGHEMAWLFNKDYPPALNRIFIH
jgi:hypothetical protein